MNKPIATVWLHPSCNDPQKVEHLCRATGRYPCRRKSGHVRLLQLATVRMLRKIHGESHFPNNNSPSAA